MGHLVIALLLAGVVAGGWKWRQAHPSEVQRAARAQAVERAAQVAQAQTRLKTDAELSNAHDLLLRGNFEQAFAVLTRLVNDGDTRAMVFLGTLHLDGVGTAKNHALAMQCFNRAANEGEGLAFVNLGAIYEAGNGEPQQIELAVNWYSKAARQGIASGLYSLGAMHSVGMPGASNNPMLAQMLLELADRAYAKEPNRDLAVPSRNSASHASGLMYELAKTLSPVDKVRAHELADAWKPGQAFTTQ